MARRAERPRRGAHEVTHERDDRPDPDRLLERLRAETARASRAHFKVFFGFAPGVGKTYAMLESARRLRAAGTDVVVGVALTHGRRETEALLQGLEILPPRRVEYRGRMLEELDLDAALARRPGLLLLDDLAHTNVPGSRHKKRWQDVLEVLDAGIPVHTTLNVQHIESLNDVIAQITGVVVRETVPDAMLERADEVELVDISPEDLLSRLREGKVYLGEQAARAVQHFFHRGNLLALRELALRRTAERVNRDVLAFREEHGVESTWPTADKILVCIGPAPASARLVRSARRMAAGLRAPWIAAYVETPASTLWSDAERQRLEGHLSLAESLGATVVRLSGVNISDPLLTYARRNNVARIILGKPTRFRLFDLLRGSTVTEIVRGSGDIDVHVISGDAAPEPTARDERQGRAVISPSSPIPWPKYGWAAALIALTTGLAALADGQLGIPDVEMLYLIAVMIAAIRFGRGPSVVGAALAVLGYDFFFVAPRFTLTVGDGRYFLSFAMMFAVSLVISTLALRIREQQQDAVQREERTAALYALSRSLGSAADLAAAARVTAEHLSRAFAAGVVLLGEDGAELRVIAVHPPGTSLSPDEQGVARWVHQHGRSAGLGTDTLPGAKVVCVPIQTAASAVGVAGLIPAEPLTADQRSYLEVMIRQAAVAFDRAELAEKARQAALRVKTEELRSTLLSTVSHDLRTPIAAITGAGTMLRDDPGLPPEVTAEMVSTICEEAERLEHIVSNLLDMTRLESGAIDLRRDWVPVVELVGGALTRLRTALSDRTVTAELPEELPLISVDPVLFEQLLVNLLENATKYTPPGSPIEIVAAREEGIVSIEVRDRGPGLPPGDEERVFERFYRVASAGQPGVGLGLSICRAIARVHGGTLVAANRPGGGAVFRLTTPAAGEGPR